MNPLFFFYRELCSMWLRPFWKSHRSLQVQSSLRTLLKKRRCGHKRLIKEIVDFIAIRIILGPDPGLFSIPNTTESSSPVQPDVSQSFKQVIAQKCFLQNNYGHPSESQFIILTKNKPPVIQFFLTSSLYSWTVSLHSVSSGSPNESKLKETNQVSFLSFLHVSRMRSWKAKDKQLTCPAPSLLWGPPPHAAVRSCPEEKKKTWNLSSITVRQTI